jgi:trehalose-6-phosphatase
LSSSPTWIGIRVKPCCGSYEAITEALDCDPAAVVTVYIGDDTTDEDAFQTLTAS